MEGFHRLFQTQGYSLIVHLKDNASFYYCLHSAIHNFQDPVSQKNADQMQKDLFEFEKKNSMYFHLFQPKSISCNGEHPSIDCLQKDLENMRKEKKQPSPREFFAAADLLQRYICIIRCHDSHQVNIQRLQGYIFAPTDKNALTPEPICILMIEKGNGLAEFANVYPNGNLTMDLSSCPFILLNEEHKHCFGLRFANEVSLLFDGSVAYGNKSDVKDLYRRLSLEFYGTENHHRRILNIICNFELEDDNLELFCKYADPSVNEESSLDEKRKLLKSHIEQIRNRMKLSIDGEFYALSSVYNIDLIVDKTGREEWETFMSVVCTYASCFDSPVILRTQTREGDFIPYVTTSKACSCRQRIPEIQGHIGRINANVHEAVSTYDKCMFH